jgi:hypothetical protein
MAFSLVLLLGLAVPQMAPNAPRPDPLALLNEVSQRYAAKFISREKIPWFNCHDADGSLGKAFQREGIPLGVLIDADGKVTFYQTGYEIPDLRAAIAKLGPQFSTVAQSGPSSK